MNFKLKVALVCLWNDPYVDERAGGPVYALEALRDNIQWSKPEWTLRCVFFSNSKRRKGWHKDFIPLPLSSAARHLNKFDFVIFSTAGSGRDKKEGAWWGNILKKLRTPFAVQIHDEAELNLLPYKDRFFKHDFFCMALPITDRIGERMLPTGVEVPTIIYPGFKILPHTGHHLKKRQIVTTCRMTSRKRIVELVNQSKRLYKRGFRLDIYGADVTWQYRKTLQEMKSKKWKYHGTFDKDTLPDILRPAAYHYNVVAFKRKNDFVPRIEIATYEAMFYGCCPILCKFTVPEWITEDMAILVDPFDMNDLSIKLDKAFKNVPKLNVNFSEEVRVRYPMNVKSDELTGLIDYICN